MVDEMTQLPRSVFEPRPPLPIWGHDDEDDDDDEDDTISSLHTTTQEAARDRLGMSPLDEPRPTSTPVSRPPSCVAPIPSTPSRSTSSPPVATDTPHARPDGVDRTHPQAPELITFWPELQAHLAHPSELPTPELRCMVCLDPLLVRGLGQQHIEEAGAAAWERCCVLPCGHLIGMGCLEAHIGSFDHHHHGGAGASAGWSPPAVRPSCPMCRLELVFRDCGDVAWGVVLPATADDAFGGLDDVPVLVRSAAEMERDCGRCRVRKTRALLDGLLGHMFNGDETMPGFMALREEQRLRGLVEEMSARICEGPSWARFDR